MTEARRRDFISFPMLPRRFLRPRNPTFQVNGYNVGAGNPQTVNRLVELLGGDVIHVPKRPGEPDCTFADISKIRESSWMGAEGRLH